MRDHTSSRIRSWNIRASSFNASASLAADVGWRRPARVIIARGGVVTVLERFSTTFPRFYLYYPQRPQESSASRAFFVYLKSARRENATQRRGRSVGGTKSSHA